MCQPVNEKPTRKRIPPPITLRISLAAARKKKEVQGGGEEHESIEMDRSTGKEDRTKIPFLLNLLDPSIFFLLFQAIGGKNDSRRRGRIVVEHFVERRSKDGARKPVFAIFEQLKYL